MALPAVCCFLDVTPVCYTEKAEEAQQHPGTKSTINPAEDNCKKQCGPNETTPNAITMDPRKRHNIPTQLNPSRIKSTQLHPSRIKSTHSCRLYTWKRPCMYVCMHDYIAVCNRGVPRTCDTVCGIVSLVPHSATHWQCCFDRFSLSLQSIVGDGGSMLLF